MLTFLFSLAAIWTLFWLIMFMIDWGDRTAFTDTKALCATCANQASGGQTNAAASASRAASSKKNDAPLVTGKASDKASDKALNKQPGSDKALNKQSGSSAQSKAVAANKGKTVVKKAVADKHDQSNVKPLFVAPNEQDDLKVIKGIGVVMEKTLNDLGITTFKQLAGFKKADIKLVTEALTGFEGRIERDEWIHQAKQLVKKAS